MNNWPDRLKLLTVLSTSRTLLAHSVNEGFGLEEPDEALRQIDRLIEILYYDSEKPFPEYWSILYAPTGPLQEIAIANGWSEAYNKLSSEFDNLEYLIHENEKEREQDTSTPGGAD